jgi:hypothetical protein
MDFRLIETDWNAELEKASKRSRSYLRIITPFLQVAAVRRLVGKSGLRVSVITRFNIDEMFRGVSSEDALDELLQNGAEIKGVRYLHSKAYIFDDAQAIVTSANLTDAALTRNHELGFIVSERTIVAECNRYFDSLWNRAGKVLTPTLLQKMRAELAGARRRGVMVGSTGLGDYGANLGYPPTSLVEPGGFSLGPEAYIKFSGIGSGRVPLSTSTLGEVSRSGMHWACCYPKGRRPRQPQAGDTMFLARLTSTPNGDDITIYGRAVAIRAHDPVLDVANASEIKVRSWKKDWPNYIRVHAPEFVAGNLANGIQLSTLMNSLGTSSFAATQRRALAGQTGINPRNVIRQRAAVHLTQQAKVWLNNELDSAFAKHGSLATGTFINLA